jgi:glutathione S-transferase
LGRLHPLHAFDSSDIRPRVNAQCDPLGHLRPTGVEMLKFYFTASPNPAKVALFLEESGMPYEIIPVDTRKGDQFGQDFVTLNPNAKVPAIVDGDVCVFDSSAILLYLAEKTGKFLSSGGLKGRSWAMNTCAARSQAGRKPQGQIRLQG